MLQSGETPVDLLLGLTFSTFQGLKPSQLQLVDDTRATSSTGDIVGVIWCYCNVRSFMAMSVNVALRSSEHDQMTSLATKPSIFGVG